MILRVFINALGTSSSDDNTDDPREGNGDDRCRTRDREQARVVLSQECAETTKNGDLDDEEPYSQDPGSTAVQQVAAAVPARPLRAEARWGVTPTVATVVTRSPHAVAQTKPLR